MYRMHLYYKNTTSTKNMSSVWSGYGYETSEGKTRRSNGEKMIRKILTFPIKVIRGILMGIGVLVFITVGICDYFIEKKGSVSPIRYSSGGKVVDINEYKEKAE